jgi:hypothetical protein
MSGARSFSQATAESTRCLIELTFQVAMRTGQFRMLVMPVHSRSKNGVASLAYVTGIHVLLQTGRGSKTWMAGTSPAMTK